MANKTSSGKGRTAAVRNRRVRQVRRVLNCVPSEKTERDWRFGNAVGAELLAARAAIPASKDLREGWWKISDQKDSGSCVGWATADSVVRWHLVKAGRLEKNQLLSPRFLWMASKETDEFDTRPTTFIEKAGTSLKAALDVARKFGTVLESVLPFATGKLSPQEPETFYALAAQRRIASYYTLVKTSPNGSGGWA